MRMLYSFVGSVGELLRALTPCTGMMSSYPCEDCAEALRQAYEDMIPDELRSNYGVETMYM